MRVSSFIIETKKFKKNAAHGTDSIEVDFNADASSGTPFAFVTLADGKPFDTYSTVSIDDIKSKFTFMSGAFDRTRLNFSDYMSSGDQFGGSLAARDNLLIVGMAQAYILGVHSTNNTAFGAKGNYPTGSNWGGVTIFSASAAAQQSLRNPAGFVVTGTLRSNGPNRSGKMGSSVSLSSDMVTFATGAPEEEFTAAGQNRTNKNRGGVYIFNSSSIGPQASTTVTFTAVFGSGEVNDVLRISDGSTTIDYTGTEAGGSDAGGATQIGIGSDRAANYVVDEFVSKINSSALNVTAVDNGGSSTNSSFTLTPDTGVTLTITEDPASANSGNFGGTAGHTAISGGGYTAGGWTQTQHITSSDGYESGATAGIQGYFGASVALDGQHLLVGAPYRWGVSGSFKGGSYWTQQGAVFAFRRTGAVGTNTWVQTQLINMPTEALEYQANYDQFGHALAISGTTAVFGQPSAQWNNNQNAGAAYVYNYSGGTWNFTQALTSSDMLEQLTNGGGHPRSNQLYDAQFGYSVDISDDKIIVGAQNMNSYSLSSSLGPYILYGTNLSSSHGITNGQNGSWYPLYHYEADAVRFDKSRLGGHNPGNKPVRFQFDVNSGRTFYMPSGSWIKLGFSSSAGISPAPHTVSTTYGTGYFDYYGRNIAYGYTKINSTGSMTLAGGGYPDSKSAGSLYNGAAYIFEKNGAGNWVHVQKLQENCPNGEKLGKFGHAVSICKTIAVVGAPMQLNSGSRAHGNGMVYAYHSSSTGWAINKNRPVLTSSLANNYRNWSGGSSDVPHFGFATAVTPYFIFASDPHSCTASIESNAKAFQQSAPGDDPTTAGNVSAYYLDTSTTYFKDTSRALSGSATAGYNIASNGVISSNGKLSLTASLSAPVGSGSDGLWADVTLISGKKYDG
jgi:hypothetical protein